MASFDDELDKILAPLTGPGLYTNNVFRITGLSVDATPTQMRRRREEAAMEARFGAPAAPSGVDAWRQPETDAETLRAAFEALRNPVLRLTHEMLWLWPNVPDDHSHNHAVQLHARVLAALASGDHAAESDEAWLASLDAWRVAFDVPKAWKRARRRVAELDDPRLTLGIVRRLEDRLPEVIVGVNVTIAGRAARNGDQRPADRHMHLLQRSSFGDAMIRGVARTAARPAEDRIEAACEKAGAAGAAGGLKAARTLFAEVDGPLFEVETLLGDDPLVPALRNQVAGVVNKCAVGYFNKRNKGEALVPLLERARDLVDDDALLELVESNLQTISQGETVAAVAEMCNNGGVAAAAARLRAWRRWSGDPATKQRISEVLDDPRGLVSPLQNVPSTGCFFVLGGHLYGGKDIQQTTVDGQRVVTAVQTYFLTFLWIPLVPLSAYITGYDMTGNKMFGGKVPLGAVARWYRLFALVAVPVAVTAFFLGAVAAVYAAVGLVAFTAVCLVLRQLYLYSWVREQTGRGDDG